MSLTNEDFARIEAILDRKLEPVLGELQALRNDIKDIYVMIANLEKKIGQKSILDPAFLELPDEEQLLRLNATLLAMAKRLGVTLPR